MSSFTNTTIQLLLASAVVLGAGVYYQGVASQRVDEASQSLRNIETAQARADSTKERAEEYVRLLDNMVDKNIDRQEPFSVVSEFSPREISELDTLLGTLYQRDGHFFLQRFYLSWQNADEKLGLLPRVALDLEGRKVLLFSNTSADASTGITDKR